jgi:ribonuclease G
MKYILINENPWQTRIAIIRDDYLQNIYFDSPGIHRLERCFFKGHVTNVLPGIQTAFVTIGQPRAGFLHISEIDRELAIKRMTGTDDEIEEDELSKTHHSPRQDMDIHKILREGEDILVQVSKEPIYEKGAKLTTCFTLPGRFLVLMPNIPRIGISKRIEAPEERQRLRELLRGNLPAGMGAIIRTTSEHKDSSEILRNLKYLTTTWDEIIEKFKTAKPEEKLYEDIDLMLQVVRDHLDSDVDMVICDSRDTESRLYKFVKKIAPEHAQKIRFYGESTPLFERYGIEQQIEQALRPKVELKSGGSIVIETTEAMTVVDVNTGRYTGSTRLEDTIFKTNLEAAEEIVRQLRLRNIGGLIVIDFIDMANAANRQRLFKHFEKTLKERDRFQSVVLKVSEFGLVQMTRKRSGKTLIQQMTESCHCCHGSGFVKSVSTESYALLRAIKTRLSQGNTKGSVTVRLHEKLFDYLIAVEYNSLLNLEKNYGCKIMLLKADMPLLNQYSIESM